MEFYFICGEICKDWLSSDKEPGLVGSQYIWDNAGEILSVGCTYGYARASRAADPRAIFGWESGVDR